MNIQIVLVGSESAFVSLKRCWRFFKIKEGRKKHNKALTVEFVPARAAFFAVLVAVIVYFGAAVALYSWRVRVPHNHIGFGDILIAPLNYDRIVRLQGRTNLDQAKEYLEKGRVLEAFYKYRAGVARVPEDHQARMTLAQFYVGSGFRGEATELLIEGLNYGSPEDRRYITLLVAMMRYDSNYPALIRVLPKVLAFPEMRDDARSCLILRQLLLKAQLVERDYAGIVDTVAMINEEPGLENAYQDTVAYALIRMGAYDEAKAFMDGLEGDVADQPKIMLLRAMLAMETGDFFRARSLYRQLFRDYPAAWRSHMDAILVLIADGREQDAEELLNLYMSMHRRNGSAILAIASRFTDMPDSERVAQVFKSVSRDAPELYGELWFYYVQALVTEGKFDEANLEFQRLLPTAPKDPTSAQIIEAYRLILAAATVRSAGEYTELVDHLLENRFRDEIYWEAAEAMRKVHAYDAAETILNEALSEYPYNRVLSRLRKRVLVEQGEFESNQEDRIASISEDGYVETDEGRVQDDDPLARGMIGEGAPRDAGTMESLVEDERLRNLELTEEDVRQ